MICQIDRLKVKYVESKLLYCIFCHVMYIPQD